MIEDLQVVCDDLKIQFDKHDQDWGIMHANANRVEEFVDYFNKSPLNQHMQFNVFELIVASYNEAILTGINNLQLEKLFIKVINNTNENKQLDIIKTYWKAIADTDNFPVGKLM